MINTVNTKSGQLANTYFSIGSGKETILVMGSCRTVPYMNYLKKINDIENNRFTINFIDPFMWNWGMNDERVDYEQALLKLETNKGLLSMLASVDIFLHEHYQNSGMFNVNKGYDKTIYDFGMKAKTDVCFPNFNDCFILLKDIITFDTDIRKMAVQDMNVIGRLSDRTLSEMLVLSWKGVEKFLKGCSKSDIPEMGVYFENNFRNKRLWHTYNHVNKNFTMAMFNFLNDKFLKLNLPNDFYEDQGDIFANSFTPLTKYDVDYNGYEWAEELKELL